MGGGGGGGAETGGGRKTGPVDLVVSAGTAGGFRARGAAIGDVYISSAVVHHDRRIPIHDAFEAFGLGRVESTPTPNLLAALASGGGGGGAAPGGGGANADAAEPGAGPGAGPAPPPPVKLGLVSSGNSLDYTDRCMEIMTRHGAHVKEMEAGAVAWVARGLFRCPAFFALKAVTDVVDGERATAEEFLANLGAAARSLQETLPRVIEFCAGKRPSEL